MNPWGYIAAAVIGALAVLYINRRQPHDTLKAIVEIHKGLPPKSAEKAALYREIVREVERLTTLKKPPVWKFWARKRKVVEVEANFRVEVDAEADVEITSAEELVAAIEEDDRRSLLTTELQRSYLLESVRNSAVLAGGTILIGWLLANDWAWLPWN